MLMVNKSERTAMKTTEPKTNTNTIKTNKLQWHEYLAGAVALLFLAAGTLRALILEAKNDVVIPVVGVLLVAFCLQAIVKLVTRK